MIRPATQADYNQVEKLCLELNALHSEIESELIQPVDTYMGEDDYRAVLKDPLQEILVLDEGQIVGVAWVAERKHQGGQAIEMSVAFVQEICVLKSRKGTGCGRALMESVEEWARTRSLKKIEFNVWARNTEAIKFYESLGYGYARHEMSKTVV